jgi:hypothetical protein
MKIAGVSAHQVVEETAGTHRIPEENPQAQILR